MNAPLQEHSFFAERKGFEPASVNRINTGFYILKFQIATKLPWKFKQLFTCKHL